MDRDYLEQTVTDSNLLREVLFVLKKNIIIFLAIIVAACAVGFVYAFTRNPKYIAEEQVLFSMGEGVEIANDVNTMNAYKATVESFAKQGVVVDRANYYAKLYFQGPEGVTNFEGCGSLDNFIEKIEYMERQAGFYRETLSYFDQIERISQELEEENLTNELRQYKNIEKASYFQRIDLLKKIALKHEELFVEKFSENPSKAKMESIETEIKRLNKLLIDAKKLNLIDKEEASYEPMTPTEIELEKNNLNSALNALIQTPGFYPTDKAEKIEIRNSTYISPGNIGISYTSKEEKTFVFGVSYTDSVASLAIEKARLLTLAFNIETSYFFTNMNAKIDDLGLKSCNIDISKTTIVLFSGVIGVILAILVVYAIYILDKTIKTKEEAERISGFPVLACIEQQEVN